MGIAVANVASDTRFPNLASNTRDPHGHGFGHWHGERGIEYGYCKCGRGIANAAYDIGIANVASDNVLCGVANVASVKVRKNAWVPWKAAMFY